MEKTKTKEKIRPLLPELRADHFMLLPADAGKWHGSDEVTTLRDLGNGIKVENESHSKSRILPVPDVWAQAVQNNRLFREGDQQTVEEWRGLLAIWALAHADAFDLKWKAGKLSEPIQEQMESGDRTFLDVANDTLPKSKIFKEMSWTDLGFMLFENNPIAIFNPETVLAPARNYADVLKQAKVQVPWFDKDEGRLRDPVTFCQLGPHRSAVLCYGVKRLLAHIDGLTDRGHEVYDRDHLNHLTRALDDFVAAIEKASPKSDTALGMSRTRSSGLPAHPVYEPFGFDVTTEYDEPEFYLWLPMRKGMEDLAKGAILVLRDLDAQIGEGPPPNRLFVWNQYTLEQTRQDRANIRRIEEEAAKKGYLVFTEKTLFTDVLCYLDEESASLKERPLGDEGKTVLPISPLLLLFFAPAEIKRMVKISRKRGTVTVALEFDATKKTGDQETRVGLHIAKSFVEGELGRQPAQDGDFGVAIKKRQPTSLDLWPDFQAEQWLFNFFFVASNTELEFNPSVPLSVREFREAVGGLPSQEKRIDRLRNAFQEKKTLRPTCGKDCRTQQLDCTDTLSRNLTILPAPPEAAACFIKPVIDGRQSEDDKLVGFILLPEPSRKSFKENRGQVYVGVDFGCTNTCVYYRKDEKDVRPVRLDFLNRCLSAFEDPHPETKDENRRHHAQYYIPFETTAMPFLTIVSARPKNEEDHFRDSPVWTHFIPFNNDLEIALRYLKDPPHNPPRTNLKWADPESARNEVLMFLSQVVLHAMAEVVYRETIAPHLIKWDFSYPEAFDNSRFKDFGAICEQAIRLALLGPYATKPVPLPALKPFMFQESVCAALYFIKTGKVPGTSGFITLDVGGSTTDVTIWDDYKLLWRGSFMFAGGDLLKAYCAKEPSLVADIIRNYEGKYGAEYDIPNVVSVLNEFFPEYGTKDELPKE